MYLKKFLYSAGLALVVFTGLVISTGLAFADDPVSVPFEPMTDEEWEAQQAAQAEHQRAYQAWAYYDQQTCGANAEHEARLHAWREACEAWNLNPELPSCGSRPQLIMPPPPSMPRPAGMTPMNCF